MTERKTWTAEIILEETPDQTDARVTLRMGDAECKAEGHARRSPEDPNVPRIGEELATARALSQLSGKLVEEAAHILENHIGHEVHLST
ncbi:MAG TPA: dsRBD fold-containing protein [Egibacteraceae bacterium]|nr:dsRBD fold-containing protein [Egibacteraceae bacterium]